MIDLTAFSLSQIEEIFALAKSFKNSAQRPAVAATGKVIALMFFEPSTRTRLSFEMAAHRAGLSPVIFEGSRGTSLEKGETVEDSILNVAAMGPECLVIRCGDDVDLAGIAKKVRRPVINAGWGVKGHPTQALLDLFTLRQKWESLRGKKLVIVGDVLHSRVAASHGELAKKFEVELAFCAPQKLLPSGSANIKTFAKLAEALSWADAVMALRIQLERHAAGLGLSKEDYRSEFGLTKSSLKDLSTSGFILHPGPINHGVEMDAEVLSDPRCLVLEQVAAGVAVREALLRWIGGGT
jgi:aspartate carbamoyltransferase catalytic subunit